MTDVPQTPEASTAVPSNVQPEPEYRIERPKPKLTRQRKIGLGVLLAGAGIAAIWTVWPAHKAIPAVETSGVEEFQDIGKGPAFGIIEPAAGSKAKNDSGFADIQGQLAIQKETLETKNAALSDEVTRLQKQLSDLATKASAEKDDSAKELAEALSKAQSQNAAMIEELKTDFGSQLAALKAQSSAADTVTDKQAADLAAKRAKTEEQLAARVASPSVVFDNGQVSGKSDGALMPPTEDSQSGSRDAAGRDFVHSGRQATAVEASQVIANSGNTVLQGTMIEATLENAVDSSLPGQLAAVVTRPVWSFDQSQILVPAGSRLFGEYSSEVSLGQGRILVAWTRLVTPDGQSVKMEAFGGDTQGRSGITGKVNSRFAQRFGSAALISLMGAAPAIAAAQYANKTSSDTAASVAQDLGSVTGSAVQDYINLPPIISVAPGAAITVMVDRDLEIW